MCIAAARRLVLWMACVGVFVAGTSSMIALPRAAAQRGGAIVVNSTADVLADDGACTLREAVIAANSDLPSGATPGECPAGAVEDEIVLPAGMYTLALAGTDEEMSETGDLDIRGHLRISGEGTPVIDAAAIDRVLHVHVGATLILEGLTVRGGRSPNGVTGPVPTSGGNGGGILSEGMTFIYDSTVSGNSTGRGGNAVNPTAHPGGSGGFGGGIYHRSGAPLVLDGVTVLGNRTGDGGVGGYSGPPYSQGGSGGSGGGIYVETLGGVVNRIHESTVSGNQTGTSGDGGWQSNYPGHAAQGAGIRIHSGTRVEIQSSEITENVGGKGKYSHGGGVFSSGELLVRDSVVEGNRAGNGKDGLLEGRPPETGGFGGGLYQESGTVLLERVLIAGNRGGMGAWGSTNNGPYATSGGSGGGVYAAGGDLEIRQSIFLMNEGGKGGSAGEGGWGGSGGGFFIDNQAIMVNSTVRENRGGDSGTGWMIYGGWGGGATIGSSGVMTVTGSLFVGNSSGNSNPTSTTGNGGAFGVRGQLALINSTLTGNRTADSPDGASGSGAGLYGAVASEISLDHVTITENHTGSSGNSIPGAGGGLYSEGTVTIDNVLLANNYSETPNADCSATVESLAYNLIEDITGCTVTGDRTGNIYGQDPHLEALADNGGATHTHALGYNSPALDAGSCGGAPQTDQRGYPRPIDLPEYPDSADGCDIGAYELQGVQVDPNLLSVTEGGASAAYQVTLTRQPTAPVTITLAVTDQITVSPTTLIFGTVTWTLPQTVTVQAVDDSDLEGDMVVRVAHESASADPFYDGLPVGDVAVAVRDNEIPPTPTPFPTPTPITTPTATATTEPSPTATASPTATRPPTATRTPTAPPSATASATQTPGVTATPTGSEHRSLYLTLIRREVGPSVNGKDKE